MKKTILLVAVTFFTFQIFAQNVKKQKVTGYGQANVLLNDMKFFGFGMGGGINVYKRLGVGVGLEASNYYKEYNGFLHPIYAEIHYQLTQQNTWFSPSFSIGFGKILGKVNYTANNLYSQLNGEDFWCFDIATSFNKKNKSYGPFVGISYKNCNFTVNNTYTQRVGNRNVQTTYTTKKGDDFFSLKFGFRF
jgi:hypothetical protein